MATFWTNQIQRDELRRGDHIYSWRSAFVYAHHGIYIGNEKVIHYTRAVGHETGTGTNFDRFLFSASLANTGNTTPCPKCGNNSDKEGVILSCLNCFLAGGNLYRFVYSVSPAFFLAQVRGGTCTLANSDPPDTVIHRAKYLLENGFGMYNLFTNNCEDFAIYCKTGLLIKEVLNVGRSGQAAAFMAAVRSVGSSPSSLTGANTKATTNTSNLGELLINYASSYCSERLKHDIGVRPDVVKVPVEELVKFRRSSSAMPSQLAINSQDVLLG